jgi:hypothetical protein
MLENLPEMKPLAGHQRRRGLPPRASGLKLQSMKQMQLYA